MFQESFHWNLRYIGTSKTHLVVMLLFIFSRHSTTVFPNITYYFLQWGQSPKSSIHLVLLRPLHNPLWPCSVTVCPLPPRVTFLNTDTSLTSAQVQFAYLCSIQVNALHLWHALILTWPVFKDAISSSFSSSFSTSLSRSTASAT